MAHICDGAVLGQIRALLGLGPTAGLTHGQLLARFAARDGEASDLAFAALVERHGPLVLRACRDIVRDEHDAQDAFQATFLILVSKGGTLWVRASLGPWLHRVACRVATRAVRATYRRKAAERWAAEAGRDRVAGPASDEAWRAIHEEIDRLPNRFRIPVLLCDAEGRTYEDVAQTLGCPIGTVKSRLARGRGRLRERLARRGLAPGSGPGWAAFPLALLDHASRAATRSMTARGTASVAVAALARGALRSMTMMQFGRIASAALMFGIVAIGANTLLRTGGHRRAIADVDKVDPGEEAAKILGTWARVSTDGIKTDKAVLMTVEMANDRPEGDMRGEAGMFLFEWSIEGQPGGSREVVLLDPSRTPGAINFYPGSKGAPKACPGIYKLEGDTITICFRPISGRRPTKFVAGGDGGVLDVYRRAKP